MRILIVGMSVISHIRKRVLGVTQKEMAAIAGTSQVTVSRWEHGELKPDLEHLTRIRAHAIQLGCEWRDEWLFNVPEAAGDAA